MRNFDILLASSKSMNLVHAPLIFRLDNPADRQALDSLFEEGKIAFVYDEIYGQLQELIKGFHPSRKLKKEEYPDLIDKHLAGRNIKEYGVWLYYPWSLRLIHCLDEDEFVEVRTNRNQYKITKEERDILHKKKIGVIGLSVGQSIALTLAMERSFGELRLADFDELELSNLNRIRAGVHNLGVPKVIITAREIAEIDPFLKVTCFFEGLTTSNMDDYFLNNGKLDILVDECDGLDMKILSRYKARELKIPVVMDTSDRGMLDVERFDLEPDRPVLHGTVEGIDPNSIRDLTNEDKVPIILKMLGIENVSLKIKASMLEVEQSINTWPQLASSVTLGGAVGADICRRILLDQFHESGRYYVDLEEIIADEMTDTSESYTRVNPFRPLSADDMKIAIRSYSPKDTEGLVSPDDETIKKLVTAACAAPSTGNDQPWKWLYEQGSLFLFHDEYRSYSFGDYQKTASYITFGGAYENLYLHAQTLGLEPFYDFHPVAGEENLVASIRFRALNSAVDSKLLALDKAIFKRHTNRNQEPRVQLQTGVIEQLAEISETIPGARFQYFKEPGAMQELGRIIGVTDRARLLNPAGHYDFIHHEMRWTSEDAEARKDGIDVKTLGFSNSQMAALGIIRNAKVIETINKLGGGKGFDSLAKKVVDSAAALCMITLPEYRLDNFFEGGRSMERFWLAATNLNLSVHPVISPFYLFSRILHGNGEGLSDKVIQELKSEREKFDKIAQLGNNRAEVFFTKIGVAQEPELKAFRLPLEKVLIIN